MPEESGQTHLDRRIAKVAAHQHGAITAAQLVTCGISTSAIGDRQKSGRLYRIHRGVYAVGQPRLSVEGQYMAAVLACGKGAVLSHRSAGRLWRILRPTQPGQLKELEAIDITVPRTGRKRRNGIALHRSSTLDPSDCTRRYGIPVTTTTRTLDDLRRVLSATEYAAAVRQAEFLGLPVSGWQRSDRPHSELEDRMLALCRRHRVRPPEVNVKVDRFLVDFLWRDERLIVEVDGWRAHRTRSAFEGDRARDARLKHLGYEVLRFTWLQIEADRTEIASTIRGLLTSRAPQQRLAG